MSLEPIRTRVTHHHSKATARKVPGKPLRGEMHTSRARIQKGFADNGQPPRPGPGRRLYFPIGRKNASVSTALWNYKSLRPLMRMRIVQPRRWRFARDNPSSPGRAREELRIVLVLRIAESQDDLPLHLFGCLCSAHEMYPLRIGRCAIVARDLAASSREWFYLVSCYSVMQQGGGNYIGSPLTS